MIIHSASEFNIDLCKSYIIDDRRWDMSAGSAAGCKTVFLDYKYNDQHPKSFDYISGSLLEATEIILSEDSI